MEPGKNKKLEVPSAENQTLRREAFVEKLLNGNEKPTMKTLKQSSDILNQVKAFMPKIKSANESLAMIDKAHVQIDEPVEGEPYVEMNVQLYEENSGTSDSDTDSTNSTVSPGSSSDEKDSSEDGVPPKQRRLITEVDANPEDEDSS